MGPFTVDLTRDGYEPKTAEVLLRSGLDINQEAFTEGDWISLDGSTGDVFADWPQQYGWWLTRREPGLRAAREAAAKKA